MTAKKKSSLDEYRAKRRFEHSKEPPGRLVTQSKNQLIFVVQKHAASHLHYDFRLEADGVLKSWAVPKGPSLNPTIKRLAMMVEDHPYEYKDFEGIIPEGYGAGTVMIWDQGTYSVSGKSARESESLVLKGLEKGEIRFSLEGEKLKGDFVLIRMNDQKNSWLFFKVKDRFTSKEEVTQQERSVVSGKTLEEIGGPGMKKVTLKKAPHQAKPHLIKPMLATLIDEPFDHEDWFFEIKLDGYRAICELDKTSVQLYSRNLNSLNLDFPLIVNQLKELKLDAIFDGEIIAIDAEGKPNFQLLQNRQSRYEDAFYYYVFDVLYFKGKDLRDSPLFERKALLQDILKDKSHILPLDHIEKNGKAFLQVADKEGFEGIIGKKKGSIYKAGARSSSWVKIKAYQRQEAIICGFTEPQKSRKHLGALILGVYRNGELQFAGHVGGGFTEKKLAEVKALLLPLVQKKCPFAKKPLTNTRATWVTPHYLCEVRFSEWTGEGIMRQPIFVGIRTDKTPKEVGMEKPIKSKKITTDFHSRQHDFLTNLDKVYWPKEKITKGAIIDYYASMASFILPYLKDRPQSLKRFPNGIKGQKFFQKNLQKPPSWLPTIPFQHHDKTINYLLIQDVESLLYAVNLGCIELHTWLSRYQTPDYPEIFVFDLDPEKIGFQAVIETALAIYEILEAIEVPSFCKTSGATGLHICVPLKGKYTYEQIKRFCLLISSLVLQQLPAIVSLERNPQKRQKKVYIDCLQNNLGQTIIAPYSLRALPGAPVSTPLEWEELKKGCDPLDFTFFNIHTRIEKKGDLFKPLLRKRTNIESALDKLERKMRVNL
jgi:bifunctional non-homologous end joining protein LigD